MFYRFKKQCERANIVNEVRERQYYEKPNQKKHKKNQEIARRKNFKQKETHSQTLDTNTSGKGSKRRPQVVSDKDFQEMHGIRYSLVKSHLNMDSLKSIEIKPNITVRFLRRNY